MNLDIEILFKTEEGNLYSLIFSEYKPDSNIIIPVVEISLALKEQKNNTNPLKVFSFIIKKIVEYLSHREVILYYYADSTPIYYRDTNKHHFISPQHFRNYLFHTLFVKENPKDLLISNRIIPNISMGNHYISFIYHPKHQPYVDILTKELEEYQK